MKQDEIERMRTIYNQEIEKSVVIKKPTLKRKIEEITDLNDRSWKNIRLDLSSELVQNWLNHGFSHEEIRDRINIGMTVDDASFCAWLRDEVQIDSEWILNNGNVEELRSEYQQHSAVIQQVPKK